MCMGGGPKTPAPLPTPQAPPPPEPTPNAPIIGEAASRTASDKTGVKSKKDGTSSLRINLNVPDPQAGNGLNIPI